MTVKELKQYHSICKEIEEKNAQLKSRTVHSTVKGSYSCFPYTSHTISVNGVTSGSENVRLMNRLRILKNQQHNIEVFIDSISDSLTRRIFEYRYIYGNKIMSWQKVAFKIGERDESYPRRIHNKFLKLAENAEK